MEKKDETTREDLQFVTTIHSIGGMYEVLKLVVILLAKYQEGIEVKDLASICILSESAISQNLSRLVKAGILEKIEGHRGSQGRIVTYKLKDNGGKTIDFIIKNLYN